MSMRMTDRDELIERLKTAQKWLIDDGEAAGSVEAITEAIALLRADTAQHHRFVDGPEFGICARCGKFSADPIHLPAHPEDSRGGGND